MNLNLVFLLLLSAVASGLLSYYQYFFKKDFDRALLIPALFRFLGIFCLLLLLINPRYHARQSVIEKPGLLIAWDASKSIQLSEAESQVTELIAKIKANKELNDQFEVRYFGFGRSLRTGDSLFFESAQTDVNRALSQLNELANSKTSPIVLISDGIQTVGRNYIYARMDQKVYPVVVGDTVVKNDLAITQVNANAFVTLGNVFEVEAFTSFSGMGDVNTELQLEKAGKVVDRVALSFSEEDRSKRIKFEVTASDPGFDSYRLRLIPFSGESEVLNNQKSFEIEVVDSQTEIAVVYSFAHPDLGMIKQSLEREQKKSVDLIPISEWDPEGQDYPVHILFQPDARFRDIFDFLEERAKNYFLITGASSDMDFVNEIQNAFSKRAMLLTEEAYPALAPDFQAFYIEDIGFEEFPALRVNLGPVDFTNSHETILRQSINGIETSEPLLSIFEQDGARRVVLFGENLWKWRAYVYQRDQSFARFDRFFDALIQYLYLSKREQELELFYEKTNFDDQEIRIRARKYDSNLNLDLVTPLVVEIEGEKEKRAMYMNNGYHEVQLTDLRPGTYRFKISDPSSGVGRSGSFEVVSYSAEQMRLTSDVASMNYLAEKTGGLFFHHSDADKLLSHLANLPEFKPVERIEKKRISLIDQEWLLALIVLSLSIEWIIRKYRGLV